MIGRDKTQLVFTPHRIALTVGSMNWFWRWAVRRILNAGFTVWMQDSPEEPFRQVVNRKTTTAVTAKAEEYSITRRAEEMGIFKAQEGSPN